jgi:predicted anti-sigma-YlaC factor YlaD
MPASDEMSCRDLVELVTEYLEGTMPAADRARFDEHLGMCPPCQIYLDQMRVTLRAMGRLPRDAVSSQAREALLRTFRDWKKQ